jgi:hypothetical protein
VLSVASCSQQVLDRELSATYGLVPTAVSGADFQGRATLSVDRRPGTDPSVAKSAGVIETAAPHPIQAELGRGEVDGAGPNECRGVLVV